MRTQFTGVEQGSAIRDEINSDASTCAACPVVQYQEGKLSGNTATAAVPLLDVVATLDMSEMAVALYASDAATSLLAQNDLAVGEIETLACQGITNLGLKPLKLLAKLTMWGDQEHNKRFQPDSEREAASVDAADRWDDTGRGIALEYHDISGLVATLEEATA